MLFPDKQRPKILSPDFTSNLITEIENNANDDKIYAIADGIISNNSYATFLGKLTKLSYSNRIIFRIYIYLSVHYIEQFHQTLQMSNFIQLILDKLSELKNSQTKYFDEEELDNYTLYIHQIMSSKN